MILKFCGMRDQDSLNEADSLGTNMCGFIFHPSSPRFISPTLVSRLYTGHMQRVGVFVENDPGVIRAAAIIARLQWIQLHGDQDVECAMAVGPERVIRVLWPERYSTPGELAETAARLAPSCAMFLLDSGNDGGGHGKTLDWARIADIELPRPWLLAGGITPENIETAVLNSKSAGVDLNSGIEESPGKKSPAKMRKIARMIRELEKKLNQ